MISEYSRYFVYDFSKCTSRDRPLTQLRPWYDSAFSTIPSAGGKWIKIPGTPYRCMVRYSITSNDISVYEVRYSLASYDISVYEVRYSLASNDISVYEVRYSLASYDKSVYEVRYSLASYEKSLFEVRYSLASYDISVYVIVSPITIYR